MARSIVPVAVLVSVLAATAACSAEPAPPVAAPADADTTATPTPSTLPFTSWPDVYEEVSSGVVRLAGVACDGVASGSGFLVQNDLVVTAAHVVADTSSLSVRAGSQVRGANVLGVDEENDVALLSLDQAVSGHVFSWADDDVRVGTDIAAVGYPHGQPLSMTQGAVTAVDRRVAVAGSDRRGLVQTDADVNPGNSGGPLIDLQGDVTGIVVAGRDSPGDGFAVAAGTARQAVTAWRGSASVFTPADACEVDAERDYPGDVDPLDVRITSSHPEAPSLAQTFRLHAEAINEGDYGTAFSLLTPTIRGEIGTQEEYGDQLDTSFWLEIDVMDVRPVDETSDEVDVAFRTIQDAEFGPEGQTCSDWRVTYTMVLDEGFWQIDRARSIVPPTQCVDSPFDDSEETPTG